MNDIKCSLTQPSVHELSVRQQIHEQLLTLDFHAFEQLARELLRLSGYSSVHMSGRFYKRGRTRSLDRTGQSRTASGGHDLRAYSRTDLASALTIVQVKQYKRVVSRRFVDELRGTMLRLRAKQGLLITTSAFSHVAHEAALASDAAPIKLIDGETLLGLMMDRRIGIYQRDDGIFALDTAWFDNLQKRYTSTDRGASRSKPSNGRPCAASNEPKHSGNVSHNKSSDDKAHSTNKTRTGGGMTWRTHLFFGINSLWLLQAVPVVADIAFDSSHLPLLLGATAFGSLLPDLDASESKIKHLSLGGIKPFLLPSQAIHRHLGHRGFSHSLAALLLLAVLVLPLVFWWGWLTPLALLLGYGSHLAADACTKSGIPFLYPRKKRYQLLPRSLRLTTGSLAEDVLFVCLAVAVLLLLLNTLNSLRAEGALFDFGLFGGSSLFAGSVSIGNPGLVSSLEMFHIFGHSLGHSLHSLSRSVLPQSRLQSRSTQNIFSRKQDG